MDDIVLLGTKEAGKTTMLSILKGDGVPITQPTQTDGHLRSDIYKVGRIFSRVKIHDTGGKDTNTSSDYREWINNAKKVCFVFNGIDFLKEIKSNTGGEIGMRIRNWVLPNFGPSKKQYYTLFFIATHADLFDGELGQAIIDCISEANYNYRKLTHSNEDRYRYKHLFDDPSHFFAINAENENEVLKIFDTIKKQDTNHI